MDNDLVERLLSIRDRAKNLTSLKPGEGYDALGFELCEIVQKTRLDQHGRSRLFAEIDQKCPSLLHDLQNISVMSEMAHEKSQTEKILNHLATRKNREAILSTPANQRLEKILFDYPYGWATVRAKEKIRLFKTLLKEFSPLPLLYFGRSMLPISGLGMHLETGLPIVWGDIHADSRRTAEDFIRNLEEFEILPAGAIRMTDGENISSEPGQALIILDDELMHPLIYKKAHKKNLPVMMSEPLGLARLLYPTAERKIPDTRLYRKHAVIVATHAHDEDIGDAQNLPSSTDDLFVSLALYRPA